MLELMFVVSCTVLPPGNFEVIEAQFGGGPLPLVSFTTPGEGQCSRTGEPRQKLFVRRLDPLTGRSLGSETQKLVATDECGIPVLSDAEWGLTESGEPILVYTSDTGINLVTFTGPDWDNAVHENHAVPGSGGWVIAGEPLSQRLSELQLEVMDFDGKLALEPITWLRVPEVPEVEVIWSFLTEEAIFKSHIHPTDPARFVRMDATGVYEFAVGGDVATIIDGALRLRGGVLRVWHMPECDCPAVVVSVPRGNGADIVVSADDGAGWTELLRVPYMEEMKVHATGASGKSVIFATGDGEARLYALDGRSFTVAEGVDRRGSEMLYFSESGLHGVYYTRGGNTEVCMLGMAR